MFWFMLQPIKERDWSISLMAWYFVKHEWNFWRGVNIWSITVNIERFDLKLNLEIKMCLDILQTIDKN